MLTATYTLVALAVEQASIRVSVAALQGQLQASLRHQQALSATQMGQACAALQRVHDNWHWRQLDMFLVPAIRRATSEADRLLGELDGLRRAAADTIAALAACAADGQAAAAECFCAGVDAFCGTVLARLEREERELFPVARSVIPGDAWFSIANQMLVDDAIRQENKPMRRRADAVPRLPAAVPRADAPLALSA